MANLEKKRGKLQARIADLESELRLSLQKKGAGTAINVPEYTRQIAKLKKELADLK